MKLSYDEDEMDVHLHCNCGVNGQNWYLDLQKIHPNKLNLDSDATVTIHLVRVWSCICHICAAMLQELLLVKTGSKFGSSILTYPMYIS